VDAYIKRSQLLFNREEAATKAGSSLNIRDTELLIKTLRDAHFSGVDVAQAFETLTKIQNIHKLLMEATHETNGQ
jgi:uncharacterized protein Smg (DUF494 family)